ncbi:sigma-54 dependent transcriptional regulator [soil metagenome]
MPRSSTTGPRILVVDDIPDFAATIKSILSRAKMNVRAVLSPRRAVRDVTRGLTDGGGFDLLITTLVMRGMGGFDVIRGVRSAGATLPIMMITGHGSEQSAIEAMRLGASDYMIKPVVPEELVARVKRILDTRAASGAVRPEDLGGTITVDPAMKAVLETVRIIATTESRVLLSGETGTGKQVIARLIHSLSTHRDEPFVDVNCAAIPDTLLESELFGHEKGAFTSADAQRIGRFEEAGRGTLFLDEIGEMSYAVQSKLLKVLQDGRFSRVGGAKTLTCQARIIAATNRDLEREVALGRFRSDLFFRLHVMSVSLPPLRKRQGDIPILAEHFLKRFSSPGEPPRSFAPETLQTLQRYNWPGNVRELENTIERIALLHRSPIIGMDALSERIVQTAGAFSPVPMAQPVIPASQMPYRQAKSRFEKDYFASILSAAGGNMAEASRRAGIDRAQFFRMVRRLKITPKQPTMTIGDDILPEPIPHA